MLRQGVCSGDWRHQAVEFLNDPVRVLTRFPFLRSLHRHGLNAFNVYSIEEIDAPKRFPVFVRIANDHEGPLTDLISDQEMLERAIKALIEIGYPNSELMIVEYAAEPIRPGIFRKLSVFRVADCYLPHVCVHDVSWIIKAGRAGIATVELYDEELEILRSNRYAECMKRVFELARIDFGRVDFSFVDGQPCIYEINTNPTIASPYPHPIPQRVESMEIWWKGLLGALHAINGTDERSRVDVSADDAATLRKALDIYPGVKHGFLHLSEAHSRSGNREAAVQCAKSALAAAPNDSRVLLGVSRLMAKDDGLQEAIDLAQRGVELDPNSVELLLHSARLLIGAKRGTEALAAVNHAISVRPEDVRCYRVLIEVQRLLGDPQAALETTTIVANLISANSGPAVAEQLKQLRSQRRSLQVEAIQKRVRGFLHSIRAWTT